MPATQRRRPILTTIVAVATAASAAACGSGGGGSGEGGTITYWLWDSAQQPGYQRCADAFAAQNPGLTVDITQYGWNDYWSKVTSGFIADTAPDVFTDHLSKFAQYVDLDVLVPLDELEATKDIQDSDYQEGLAELEGAGRTPLRRPEGLGHDRDLLRRGGGRGCRYH